MIGLLDYCAFLPNRMCSEKHLVLSVRFYCILIVCLNFTKPVHIQSWESFSLCFLSSYTQHKNQQYHQQSMNCLKPRLPTCLTFRSPTAVATIGRIGLTCSLPLELFSLLLINRGTDWTEREAGALENLKNRKYNCKGGNLYLHHPLLLLLLFWFQF